MARRVLITGGSGFIGANLARRALRDGHEVHLLLRAGHDDWRLGGLAREVSAWHADLADRSAVRDVVAAARPDWVFHLAAYGAYSWQQGLAQMMTTNFWGFVHLLDACRDAGVEAVVNAGSSSEYGFKAGAARESDRLEPNSDYAVSKAAATHYGELIARQSALNVTTLRLYSVYGPYEAPERLVPTLVVHGLHRQLPALASRTTARDFVYVDDAVEAMLHVAQARPSGGVYNVCTGVQTTLGEVVDIVRRDLEVAAEPSWGTLPPRAWDTDSWVGSPDKLEADTGWRPRTGLDEGVSNTIRWFREHPDLRRWYEQRVLERAAAGS